DEIIRLLSMCVAIRPASAHALVDLGSAYHTNEQLDLAVAALEKATALQPDRSRGWMTLAVVIRDMGDPALAARTAEKAVECEEDPDALVRISAQYWRRGLNVAARSAVRKAVETAPEHALARVEVGRMALIEGAYEEAIASLRE